MVEKKGIKKMNKCKRRDYEAMQMIDWYMIEKEDRPPLKKWLTERGYTYMLAELFPYG